MKARKQWVLWCYECRNERPTKRPLQIDGRSARVIDPTTWSDFKTVTSATGFDGLGYVFAIGDGLVGIDLDHCVVSDGEVSPWAMEILQLFQNSYIEWSPSGDGLHIICQGKASATGAKKWKDADGREVGFEIYDHTSPRYFTVTGDVVKVTNNEIIAETDGVPPNDVIDCQAQIDRLYQMFWTDPDPTKSEGKPTSAAPKATQPGISIGDEDLESLRDAPPFHPGRQLRSLDKDWPRSERSRDAHRTMAPILSTVSQI